MLFVHWCRPEKMLFVFDLRFAWLSRWQAVPYEFELCWLINLSLWFIPFEILEPSLILCSDFEFEFFLWPLMSLLSRVILLPEPDFVCSEDCYMVSGFELLTNGVTKFYSSRSSSFFESKKHLLDALTEIFEMQSSFEWSCFWVV